MPLLDLAGEHFVSLTTFRKTGVGVPTTVWIARDGDDLIVTTPQGTGKVKRLRNNPRVTLAPSTRMGKVHGTAVEGTATIEPETPELTKVFADKYKTEYRIFMWVERRANGKAGQKPRQILRISSSIS